MSARLAVLMGLLLAAAPALAAQDPARVASAAPGAGLILAAVSAGSTPPTLDGRQTAGVAAPAPAAPAAQAQDGLGERWRAGRAAAAQRGWGSYWIGYSVRPRPGTRVVETNSPNPRAGGAGGANVEPVRLGAAPAASDAVFLFRLEGGSETPVEMKIRAGMAPSEIAGAPVVWLGPASDAESLALLERVRPAAPEPVRREIGPAASLHADAGQVVPFVRAVLASEPSPKVRAEAAYWLQHQPTAESLALLEEVVRRDASPKVREEAVTGIAQMNTDAALQLLQRLADDVTLPLAVRREAMDWRSRARRGS
jgi:hypothetical protein